MEEVTVGREDLLAGPSRALVAALDAELTAAYPEPGATHFRLDPDEVAPGRGAFLVARAGDAPAGCGALRLLEGGDAEVKRMFVVPALRGRGVGRRILEALEAEARRLGARRLVLETGTRQLPAIALYRSAGLADIPPYGDYLRPGEEGYLRSGLSLFLGKSLSAPPPRP
jgi:GNAT superfamily N-acetyltransferase